MGSEQHIKRRKVVSNLKGRSKKRKSLFQVIRGWFLFILIIVALIFIGMRIVGSSTTVSGSAMYPSLADGDRILVDKITYKIKNPDRFDVVIFPFRYQEDTEYIRRVIALPGETVQILDGEIYINGILLKEDASLGLEKIEQAGIASAPITLGADEYFVLGDNRNDCTDSREPSVGNIRRDEITGRALLITWPMDRFGLLG